jgi:histidine triad (HIT) family protein
MSEPDCVFCKIVAGQIPAERLYEDEALVAFKDLHPQAPFHALVIPKRHLSTLNDFAADDADLAGAMLFAARRLATEHGLPGYRVAMNVNKEGGQVVFHAHLHVLGGRPLKGSLG